MEKYAKVATSERPMAGQLFECLVREPGRAYPRVNVFVLDEGNVQA
jgi:hypothetical protein